MKRSFGVIHVKREEKGGGKRGDINKSKHK